MSNLPIQKIVTTEIILLKECGWKRYINYEGDQECKICLDSMKDGYILESKCKHLFHVDCVLRFIVLYENDCCPECMTKIE